MKICGISFFSNFFCWIVVVKPGKDFPQRNFFLFLSTLDVHFSILISLPFFSLARVNIICVSVKGYARGCSKIWKADDLDPIHSLSKTLFQGKSPQRGETSGDWILIFSRMDRKGKGKEKSRLIVGWRQEGTVRKFQKYKLGHILDYFEKHQNKRILIIRFGYKVIKI